MIKTVVSIVIMIVAAFIGKFLGERNGIETFSILFAMIAGFTCVIHSIESQKKE